MTNFLSQDGVFMFCVLLSMTNRPKEKKQIITFERLYLAFLIDDNINGQTVVKTTQEKEIKYKN